MFSINIVKQAGTFLLKKAWTVKDGETIALLGASGSGKTMTLKCIAGLIKPDKGLIKMDDVTYFNAEAGINIPPQKREVGYVPQQYALFPHLDVEANVSFGLKGIEKEQRRQIVNELLLSAGLEKMSKRYPSHLSGGEKQRVALVRALAAKPSILLLDEPFAAVDSFRKKVLREELKAFLAECSIPAVLVSHDERDVEALESRVVLY